MKFTSLSFLLGVVRYVQTCPKCSKSINCEYLWKETCDYLHSVQQSNINESNQFIILIFVKFSKITNCQCFNKGLIGGVSQSDTCIKATN